MRTLRHITATALFAMISTAALANMPPYRWIPIEGVATPKSAMLFTSGKNRSLRDFKDKVVLLNLWATWCGPCRQELPTLEALEKELAPQGLVVIALSIEHEMTPEELRAFLKEEGIAMPHVAIDTDRAMAKAIAWGAGVPITFLVDRKGTLRYKYKGAADWTEAPRKDTVLELLAEGKGR